MLPEYARVGYCRNDGVKGIFLRWKSVADATYFLYYYKTESLLSTGPHDHAIMMPPRFVEASFGYSAEPVIDIGHLMTPEMLNKCDDVSNKITKTFPMFNTFMHVLDNDAWRRFVANKSSGVDIMRRTPPPQVEVYLPREERRTNGINSIDVGAIRDGADVRTTAMVRNLPSEVTFNDVKLLCDQVCPGRYDFLYLRSSFNTGKQLGYFFIDLIDPMTLLHFFNSVEGYPVPGHEASGQRLRLSYANLQGLNQCIDHFRNSVVMMQEHSARPHVSFVPGL